MQDSCLCLQEVINILRESKADVFVDPVLHTACALDLKHYCAGIPPGEGRRECCVGWIVQLIMLSPNVNGTYC